jgi:hypothetical protein
MLKRVIICILGVVIAFVLIAIFVQIDVNFTYSSGNTDPASNGYDAFKYGRVLSFIWRSTYIYNPICIIITTLYICFFDKSKTKYYLSIIATAPITLLSFVSSNFQVKDFALLFSYILISLVICFMFPNRSLEFEKQKLN